MAAERIAALIPAAGSGARLGLGPKAFVPLGGRPLLTWSVESVAGLVHDIVVAVPAEREAQCRQLLPTVAVVTGGDSRQQTVSRLLAATDARWVLIHDAARPFLPQKVVAEVVAAVQLHSAVTVALPVADTLYHAGEDRTVDRSEMYAVQTPQAFDRTVLLRAHQFAEASALTTTDDAELVRRSGFPVVLVPGSAWLTKITRRDDLAWAEALAPVWSNAPQSAS